MYIVNIVGYTWEGFRSTYEYPAKRLPMTTTEIKRLARDFETVEDYQVSQITTTFEPLLDGWRETRTLQVLRPWATEEVAEMEVPNA